MCGPTMSLRTAAYATMVFSGNPSLSSGIRAKAHTAAWIGMTVCQRTSSCHTLLHTQSDIQRMHFAFAVPKPVPRRNTLTYEPVQNSFLIGCLLDFFTYAGRTN